MAERKELNDEALEKVAGGILSVDYNNNMLYAGEGTDLANWKRYECTVSADTVNKEIAYAYNTLGLRGDAAILNYLMNEKHYIK